MKTDITPEDIEKLDKELRKAHELYTKEIMKPIVNVYIDLPLLIDYKLGALLFLYSDNSDAFDYITKIISTDYNVMIGRNITEKFPLLPVTEEDIKLCFSTFDGIKAISKLSPITTVHDNFFRLIEDLYQNNLRFNDFKKSRVNLFINNPYFETPDDIKHHIRYKLLEGVACNTFFHCDPDYTLPEIEDCEYIFLDDFSKFNQSPLVKKMFEAVFVEKTICGAYITEEASRLDNEEAGEFFSEVHRLMNLKTDFKFIHKMIPIEQNPKPDKD